MCGIAGLTLSHGEKGDRFSGVVQSMTDVLAHRGRDGRGIVMGKRYFIGHRRLAIIDLEGGIQPMVSEDGNSAITFNGEIYNYREIMQGLCNGVSFRTHSDTEVLLYALREKGTDVIPLLRGMFAFGYHEDDTGRVILARDHFGKKPLFYTIHNGRLIYASEIKSLLTFPGINAELDPDSFARLMFFGFVPPPDTLFRGIHCLPPGHYLEFRDGVVKLVRYWHLGDRWRAQGGFLPEQDGKNSHDEFGERFRQSVARRMVSDVPVGLFLSGGLDSNAILSELLNGETGFVKECFTVRFQEKSYDEYHYIRDVVRRNGLRYHEIFMQGQDVPTLLDRMFSHADAPTLEPNQIQQIILSELARSRVKVVMCGCGADEVLNGYQTNMAYSVLHRLRHFPQGVLKSIFGVLTELLPPRQSYFSWHFKMERFKRGVGVPFHMLNQLWLAPFLPNDIWSVLHPDMKRRVCAPGQECETEDRLFNEQLRKIYCETEGMDAHTSLNYHFVHTFLPNCVNSTYDTYPMMYNLEVRSPFQDVDLVEYLFRLPLCARYDRFTGKRVLRSYLQGKLPRSLVNQKKKGFAFPLQKWMKLHMSEAREKYLSRSALEASGLFNVDVVLRMTREHDAGIKNYDRQLYAFMVAQAWYDRWIAKGLNQSSLQDEYGQTGTGGT